MRESKETKLQQLGNKNIHIFRGERTSIFRRDTDILMQISESRLKYEFAQCRKQNKRLNVQCARAPVQCRKFFQFEIVHG